MISIVTTHLFWVLGAMSSPLYFHKPAIVAIQNARNQSGSQAKSLWLKFNLIDLNKISAWILIEFNRFKIN